MKRMAGPQIQRPTSAYYSGQNGTDRVGGGASGGGSGLVTSFSSHTGLYAIRTISHDSELIYRGNASHTIITDMPTPGTSQTPIQQSTQPAPPSTTQSAARMCNIAATGHPSSDALIIPTVNLQPTHSRTNANVTTTINSTKIAKSTQLLKSSTRDKEHSIELVDDASQCTNDPGAQDSDDVEQGKARRSSRHRHRPLHRRFFNYVKNFFQRTVTQTDSELEEFDTPARYRPDSLGALSRATRFTEDEIKRIYRGFKAECPTGVIKEETFKVIYSQFFPQGGSCANPTLYAHYIFNTLDQDRSGIVSFEDFVQGLSILSRGSVEEKLRWTFSLYDINGDGFITREEMTDIVTAIYELMGRLPDELPEEEKIKVKVEQLFQKMDINRDGVVTLDEFLEACRTDEAISKSMSVFDSAF